MVVDSCFFWISLVLLLVHTTWIEFTVGCMHSCTRVMQIQWKIWRQEQWRSSDNYSNEWNGLNGPPPPPSLGALLKLPVHKTNGHSKSNIGGGLSGGGSGRVCLVHLRQRDEDRKLDVDPHLRIMERLQDFFRPSNRDSHA